MNKRVALLVLAAVCIFSPTTVKAQANKTFADKKWETEAKRMTAKEWVDQADSKHATAVLMYLLADVKTEAIDHYAAKGNIQRTRIVQDLNPDIKDLMAGLRMRK